jgi:hypothetical protein
MKFPSCQGYMAGGRGQPRLNGNGAQEETLARAEHITQEEIMDQFMVVYRKDIKLDGQPGGWHASSQPFASLDEAVIYARRISPSRDPRVLQIVWERVE